MKVPAPVKVMRTRDEDLQHGFYRPASYHVLRGGINRKKAAVAWSHRLVYPDGAWVTGGAADINYAIPNVYVDHHTVDIAVPVGAFRSVAHTATGFVNESFIDELAHAAGADPYQFRRELMKNINPRLTAVMDGVAKQIGWGKRKKAAATVSPPTSPFTAMPPLPPRSPWTRAAGTLSTAWWPVSTAGE